MRGYFFQQTLNGIQLGSIYALIALGYTMVYGIIRLINFAHADLFMVGAYTAFFVIAFSTGSSGILPPQVWIWLSLLAGYLLFSLLRERVAWLRGTSLWLTKRTSPQARALRAVSQWTVHLTGLCVCAAASFPVLYYGTRLVFSAQWGPLLLPVTAAYVMAVCGLIGLAMERIAYRPLRYRPRLSALITALGVSLFLENFCSLPVAFGNAYRPFVSPVARTDILRIPSLDLAISSVFAINILVLAVLLLALWFLVEKTLLGKQMRAVAFDKKAASLMGIDVDRVISVTFVIGPALAGASGLLYAMNYGILQSPFLGFFPGLKAFIAAVLGGIGSLPGAVIGALIMGVTEVFANSVDSNLGFAAAFVVLIVILLLRPAGIMGKEKPEKI